MWVIGVLWFCIVCSCFNALMFHTIQHWAAIRNKPFFIFFIFQPVNEVKSVCLSVSLCVCLCVTSVVQITAAAALHVETDDHAWRSRHPPRTISRTSPCPSPENLPRNKLLHGHFALDSSRKCQLSVEPLGWLFDLVADVWAEIQNEVSSTCMYVSFSTADPLPQPSSSSHAKVSASRWLASTSVGFQHRSFYRFSGKCTCLDASAIYTCGMYEQASSDAYGRISEII